jgi:hypothetical protein
LTEKQAFPQTDRQTVQAFQQAHKQAFLQTVFQLPPLTDKHTVVPKNRQVLPQTVIQTSTTAVRYIIAKGDRQASIPTDRQTSVLTDCHTIILTDRQTYSSALKQKDKHYHRQSYKQASLQLEI